MDRNRKQWAAIGIFIALMLIVSVGYRLGYRIQNNLLIGHVGVMKMTLPFSETSVFVDKSQKITSSKDNAVVNITLSPGRHSVIVSKESFFPWAKEVTMKSSGEILLSPILISQNPSGQIITENDPEYWKIKNQIRTKILPTKEYPLVSLDKSVSVWVEKNAVMLSNKSDTIKTVIQPLAEVKNLSFYKNRPDALIFSAGDSVSMIETDTENMQNFMPIYQGQNPKFVETGGNYIYIEDNAVLMQVII